MKITTAEEMRTIDRVTSEKHGVHSLALMENAGTAVANFARTQYPQANRITVVCGKGNNGGDGFVAARRLHNLGRVVEVLLLADSSDLKGDAANMFSRLPFRPITIRTEQELRAELSRSLGNTDLIIDAILGTGFKPPVTGLYAAAIDVFNHTTAPIISVDIPSGANADAMAPEDVLVARSDAIVTFTAPRPAHVFGRLTRGPVVVASIGSPAEAVVSALNVEVITATEVAPLLAWRAPDANKGRFGHVLVIGGSAGKAGAPSMTGMGALRTGAGLVTVATPKSMWQTVSGFAPELMTEPLAETAAGTISMDAYAHVEAVEKSKSVIAIGPGLSRNSQTEQFARRVVQKAESALVVDADGLNAFEQDVTQLQGSGRTLVITPHPGEMARLSGSSVADVQKDRIGIARGFAFEHDCIVVLKGDRTIVASPEGETWVNANGNPGMATGGTGDILTGMVAGMVAQFPTQPLKAVLSAVYLHGMSGDLARDEEGEMPMIATDLLYYIGAAMQRTRQWASEKMTRIS